MFRIISLLVILLFTFSCSFLQNKLPSTTPANYPSSFSMYGDTPDYTTEWWKQLDSKELNKLMDIAINDNFNIVEAWAKLEQAKAQAAKSDSYLYPNASINTGISQSKQKKDKMDEVDSTTYSLGLSVSYELDLWGKIKSNKNSLDLELKASKEDVSTTIMTITSQIAEVWINIISLNRQKESLKEQLIINKKLLELIEIRFKNAQANALDIFQQQQSIAAIEAAIIPIIAQKQLLTHQLALLLGKPTTYNIALTQKDFPIISDIPKAGIPSDLLAMRPDIRSAGLKLKSANWEIAAAKADRLPSIKLTASYTYSSDEVSTIFDNWLMNLAANLTGPIFDAGRRKNEVKRVEAIVDEKLATYQETILTAFKEVEDALSEEKYNKQVLKAKQQQLILSKKTLIQAYKRYINGVSDYLSVLTEQLNIASFENSIIKAQADIINSRIQLQKAVGGSWVENIQPNKKSNNKK